MAILHLAPLFETGISYSTCFAAMAVTNFKASFLFSLFDLGDRVDLGLEPRAERADALRGQEQGMWEVDMKSSEWDADCVDSQSGRGRDEEQKEANKFL